MACELTLNSFGCSVCEHIFTCFRVLGKGLNNAYSFVIYAVPRLASKDISYECPSGPGWSINLQYICYRLLLSFFFLFIAGMLSLLTPIFIGSIFQLLFLLFRVLFLCFKSFPGKKKSTPRIQLIDLQKLPLRFTQDLKLGENFVQNIFIYIRKRKMLLPLPSWFTERSVCFIVGKCLYCDTGNLNQGKTHEINIGSQMWI